MFSPPCALHYTKTTKKIPMESPDFVTPTEFVLPRLSTWRNSILIGLFYFVNTFAQLCLNSSLLLVYVNEFHMSLFSSQISGPIYFIVNIIFGTFIGYIGDKIITRIGRRKPLVIAGQIVVVFSLIISGLPPSLSQSTLLGWYILNYCLSSISISLVNTGLNSWLVESTADEADYLYLTGVVTPIGFVLGFLAALPLALGTHVGPYLAPIFNGAVAVILSLLLLPAFFYLVPNPTFRAVERQPPLIPSLRICLQTPEFRIVLANEILIATALMIGSFIHSYYLSIGFQNVIKTQKQFLVYFVVLYIAGNVGALIVRAIFGFVIRYVSKLKIYTFSTLIVVVISILTLIAALTKSFMFYYIMVIFSIMIVAPITLVDSLFLRDLVMLDTLTTGLERASTYQMAITIPGNMAASLLSTIPQVIIYASGYNQNSNYDDDHVSSVFKYNTAVLDEMIYFGSILIGFIALLSYFIILRYPLTESLVDKINTAVQKRREQSEKDAAERDAEGESRDVGFSSSSSSSSSLGSRQSSIAENQNEMLMLHFSLPELQAMSESDLINGNNRALTRISLFNLGGVCLSLISVCCCLAGATIQYKSGHINVTFILIILMTFSIVYCFYEFLRYSPIQTLFSSGGNETTLKASTSLSSAQSRSENLCQHLTKLGVVLDASDFPQLNNNNHNNNNHNMNNIDSQKKDNNNNDDNIMSQNLVTDTNNNRFSLSYSGVYLMIYLLLIGLALFGIFEAIL